MANTAGVSRLTFVNRLRIGQPRIKPVLGQGHFDVLEEIEYGGRKLIVAQGHSESKHSNFSFPYTVVLGYMLKEVDVDGDKFDIFTEVISVEEQEEVRRFLKSLFRFDGVVIFAVPSK